MTLGSTGGVRSSVDSALAWPLLYPPVIWSRQPNSLSNNKMDGPSSVRRAPPRWHRRPVERPEEIVRAALTVFGEQGFARARLEDIARRAGIRKGTLYLYFDSKEALFREMVRTKIVAAVAAGEAEVHAFSGSSRERLRFVATRIWKTVNNGPDHPPGPFGAAQFSRVSPVLL